MLKGFLFIFISIASAASLSAMGRSVTDQPDDHEGFQIKVVYAVPQGAPDKRFDTSAAIKNTTESYLNWLSQQTSGSTLRVDRSNGMLDVLFVSLPQTEAIYLSKGAAGIRNEIEKDMRALGVVNDSKKIYVVYYEGRNNNACADAFRNSEDFGGQQVAVVYLNGLSNSSFPCSQNQFSPDGASSSYLEYVALHEILHTLGIVPNCAPNHHLNGHTSDNRADLMWAGSGFWDTQNMRLDIGRDDYFDHNNSNCLDLKNSAFLEPLPGSPESPPGFPRFTIGQPYLPATIQLLLDE